MGYSHYWDMPRGTCRSEWDAAIPAIKHIIKRHRAVLAFEMDMPRKPPLVSPTQGIRFNGIGGNGCETFMVYPGSSGDSCKTNRAPYDQAVCECLLVLRAHLAGFSLRSDGFSGCLKDGAKLDGAWPEAVDSVKTYGLFYGPFVSNERSPYCDIGMRLTMSGVDGIRVFDDEGNETKGGE